MILSLTVITIIKHIHIMSSKIDFLFGFFVIFWDGVFIDRRIILYYRVRNII